MLKEPKAGRVKSRLARDVGAVAATRFFRLNLTATLSRLNADPRWQTLISVAPDSAVASRMFPPRIVRMAQGGGDLGQRLARGFRNAQPGPLVIIGADIPGIRANDIARAFRTLIANDAVIGPSGDGGYWLIGLNARKRGVRAFERVRWSSPYALADTITNLHGLSVAIIGAKDDVDNGGDLRRLGANAGRLIAVSQR